MQLDNCRMGKLTKSGKGDGYVPDVSLAARNIQDALAD